MQRRSLRLRGLPASFRESDLENEGNKTMNGMKRKPIKTPIKKTIFDPSSKSKQRQRKRKRANPSSIDGEISGFSSDHEQIEGVEAVQTKPSMNIAETVVIDDDNVDSDPDEIRPPQYVLDGQLEEAEEAQESMSSDNELHEEEVNAVFIGNKSKK